MATTYLVDRRRTLTTDKTLSELQDKHPKHTFEVLGQGELSRVPSMATLEAYVMDREDTETPDGCVVEPDGQCEHGYWSWLRVMGLI